MQTIRKDLDKEYFECECLAPDHRIVLSLERGFVSKNGDSDWSPIMYLECHLQRDSFFKRLWRGLRYIFGGRSKWGEYGEFVVRSEDCDKFISAFKEFQLENNRYWTQVINRDAKK